MFGWKIDGCPGGCWRTDCAAVGPRGRKKNFVNGRIIKGDSNHVSGMVHTITCSELLLNGRWWVCFVDKKTSTLHTRTHCTRIDPRHTSNLWLRNRILHSRGKVPIVWSIVLRSFQRNLSRRSCQKIRDTLGRSPTKTRKQNDSKNTFLVSLLSSTRFALDTIYRSLFFSFASWGCTCNFMSRSDITEQPI